MPEVADDGGKPFVPVLPKPTTQIKKRVWLYITVPIVLVAGVVVGALYYHHQSVNVSTVCSSTAGPVLLHNAGAAIYAANIKQLRQVAQTVQKEPHYQQDPNCLYIMVNYYIDSGDSKNASFYLDKLNQAYQPNKGLSAEFGLKIPNISYLETDLSTLKKDQSMSLSGTFPNEP
jgi:hypothetical protein